MTREEQAKALGKIRRKLNRIDVKKQRVAKRAGISRTYFSLLLHGHRPLNEDLKLRIYHALRIKT